MSSLGEQYLQESVKGFHGLKRMAEKTFTQIDNDDFFWKPEPESNSIALLTQHVAGNMLSRWTDFLTSDGEKPDRNRDMEFEDAAQTKEELMERWEKGWKCLFEALASLKEEDLLKTVFIRAEAHSVVQAIERQTRHYSIHIGQIVMLAKARKGASWHSLSIPKKVF